MRRAGGLVAILLAALLAALLAGCGRGDGLVAPARAASAPAGVAVTVAVARGVVEAPQGVFELLPPQDGTVAEVAVREGDSVRPGQLLLRLDAHPQQQERRLVEAESAVAEARLRAAEARLPAARELAERLQAGVRADVVEPQRLDEARQALQELQSAAAVARAEAALAQRRLAQADAAAARLSLLAPVAAEVLRVQVQPGARVLAQGGRPLLLLLPRQTLRVRAELSEAWVGRVRPGQHARVLADGDLPADAAGDAHAAQVTRLAPMFGASRLDPDAPPRAQPRVLDCYLEFDGGAPAALRAGQAVRVEFLP